MRSQAGYFLKDSASVPFVQKLVTYPLYYDIIRILHDYGLYLEPNTKIGLLAPSLNTIAEVITKTKKRADTNFDELVKRLVGKSFSTLYKPLLQAGNLTNKNRVDITPSLFFIFLTYYNVWLRDHVFDCDNDQIVSGGVYVKASGSTADSDQDKKPLDVLKFRQNSPASDENASNAEFAKRISQFSLAHSDERLTNVYTFAAFFFNSYNEGSGTNGISQQYVRNYLKGKEYDQTNPMITLKTEDAKSASSSTQAQTTTTRTPRKKSARKSNTVSAMEAASPIKKSRSSNRKSQNSNTNTKTGTLDLTTKLVNLKEPDIKQTFMEYAGVIQLKTKTEMEKRAFLDIYNKLAKKSLNNVDDFIQDDEPLKKNPLDSTKKKNPLDSTKPGEMTPFLWLLHKGHDIISNQHVAKFLNLGQTKFLTDPCLAKLFGFGLIFHKRSKEENWIVLEVGNNQAVYKAYNAKTRANKKEETHADNDCKEWVKATVNFLVEAQKNGWVLNLTDLDPHPAVSYIVLCTEEVYKSLQGMNDFDLPTNGDETENKTTEAETANNNNVAKESETDHKEAEKKRAASPSKNKQSKKQKRAQSRGTSNQTESSTAEMGLSDNKVPHEKEAKKPSPKRSPRKNKGQKRSGFEIT